VVTHGFASHITGISWFSLPVFEASYGPKTNLEFRLRSTFLVGDKKTEYGEKQNDYKIELRVRYYF